MKTPAISVDQARLLAAAAVIRERGHVNHCPNPRDAGACLLLSLAIVDGEKHWAGVHGVPPILAELARKRTDWPQILHGKADREAVYLYNLECTQASAIAILEEAAALS